MADKTADGQTDGRTDGRKDRLRPIGSLKKEWTKPPDLAHEHIVLRLMHEEWDHLVHFYLFFLKATAKCLDR